MPPDEIHRPDTTGGRGAPSTDPVDGGDGGDGRERGDGGDGGDPADTIGGLQVETGRTPEGWLSLAAETASVPIARRYVRRALQRLLPEDRLDPPVAAALSADLELAASELVTNAVEHGAGRTLELSVSCDGAVVALEVTSQGAADRVEPPRSWRIADIGSTTGRGLGIVRTLSDRVSVNRSDGNVSIRIERDLPT